MNLSQHMAHSTAIPAPIHFYQTLTWPGPHTRTTVRWSGTMTPIGSVCQRTTSSQPCLSTTVPCPICSMTPTGVVFQRTPLSWSSPTHNNCFVSMALPGFHNNSSSCFAHLQSLGLISMITRLNNCVGSPSTP